jgi:hypothetical protein
LSVLPEQTALMGGTCRRFSATCRRFSIFMSTCQIVGQLFGGMIKIAYLCGTLSPLWHVHGQCTPVFFRNLHPLLVKVGDFSYLCRR